MAAPDSQREVAEFLARITGQGVVETHISLVFLGADEALKLKKAVDLGFLDFTRLADRARLTQHEYALNAPHAGALYLGALPITRGPDGALRLGGDGPALDWVLRMRRLPPDAFLDGAPPLPPRGLDALADAVVALHAAAPAVREGGAMRDTLAGNRAAGLSAGLPAPMVEAWFAAASARRDVLHDWLLARATAGFRRRCHGDLHLGNICLLDGAPTPFDALEFDEQLATIDTGYDLAFLLMDLDQRWGRACANRVLNRWVARNGDAPMLRGMPLWLSLRAFIRAHVAGRRGDDALPLLRAALAYLDAAPPRLVAIGGLQGTGKSTLARAVAPELGAAPGALVLRSDEIRKRLAGVAPEAALPPAAYTAEASAAVMAEQRAMAQAALDAGQAVVADAVFQRPAERDAMAALHPRFLGVWLEAPLDLLRARITARRDDASDATVAVLEASAARDAGCITWARVHAGDSALPRLRAMLDLEPSVSP